MKEIMTEKKRIQSSKAETERVNEHLTSEAKEEVKPKVIQRVDI